MNMARILRLSAQNVAVLGSMMTLSGAAGSIFIGLATRRLLGALKSRSEPF